MVTVGTGDVAPTHPGEYASPPCQPGSSSRKMEESDEEREQKKVQRLLAIKRTHSPQKIGPKIGPKMVQVVGGNSMPTSSRPPWSGQKSGGT